MRGRAVSSLRLLVVSLVLAGSSVRAIPVTAAVQLDLRTPELATSARAGETVTLPSGRGEGHWTVQNRARAPLPLAAAGTADVRRAPSCARAPLPPAPRARSHPIRHRPRSADDPPPH